MNKLSSEKIAEVLKSAQEALLSVTSERDKLAAENHALKQHDEAEKLAFAMHEKGVRMDMDHAELVETLEKAASEGRLEVVKEALDLTVSNMDLSNRISERDTGSGNAFEAYLLGSIG